MQLWQVLHTCSLMQFTASVKGQNPNCRNHLASCKQALHAGLLVHNLLTVTISNSQIRSGLLLTTQPHLTVGRQRNWCKLVWPAFAWTDARHFTENLSSISLSKGRQPWWACISFLISLSVTDWPWGRGSKDPNENTNYSSEHEEVEGTDTRLQKLPPMPELTGFHWSSPLPGLQNFDLKTHLHALSEQLKTIHTLICSKEADGPVKKLLADCTPLPYACTELSGPNLWCSWHTQEATERPVWLVNAFSTQPSKWPWTSMHHRLPAGPEMWDKCISQHAGRIAAATKY